MRSRDQEDTREPRTGQRSSAGKTIHIQLSLSRAPRAFRDQQNLWKDELSRIYRLLERQVDVIEQLRSPDSSDRRTRLSSTDSPHLSIAMFGPSGSGKSSLLRTLQDDIEREGAGVGATKLRQKVVSLPVMDPTTWRHSDQFLYAFLASALVGGRILTYSDAHYGAYYRILAPGRGADMGDGWETRRRRGKN